MSEPAGILDAQLQSLLALVTEQRDARCEAIRAEAEAQAHELLHKGYREARQRMHEAIEEERGRIRHRLEATSAQLQTRERQHRHQRALLLLHRGWEILQLALEERWRVEGNRGQWLQGLFTQALRDLPARPWRIVHPPGWSPEELGALTRQVSDHCGAVPQFEVDNSVKAGLRIHSDGACLDATLEGLLADRSAVEAMLLAELNRLLATDQLPHGKKE
jgi:hypothetical protein